MRYLLISSEFKNARNISEYNSTFLYPTGNQNLEHLSSPPLFNVA